MLSSSGGVALETLALVHVPSIPVSCSWAGAAVIQLHLSVSCVAFGAYVAGIIPMPDFLLQSLVNISPITVA